MAPLPVGFDRANGLFVSGHPAHSSPISFMNLPLRFLPRTVRCLRGILLLLSLLSLAETTQAQTTIRYVKPTAIGSSDGSSWTNASADLQSQINIAGAQQVWVAGGRYTASGSFLLRNGVAVYGGFRGDEASLPARPVVNPVGGQPSSTTLTTTAGAVIQTTNLDNTARLDGMVITGGSNDTAGGGVLNQSSSPVLTNCLISGNTAGSNGGGISNVVSSPILTNCVISGNTAGGNGGGIASESGSAPVLTNCIVSGNTAGGNGGGVYNGSSNPVLTNCVISSNAANLGGGVYSDTSSPRLVNCTLTANRARAGVALGNYNGSQC